MKVAITTLPCPVKSQSDLKEYRHIKLPNGLQALLISDFANVKLKVSEGEAEFDSECETDESNSEDDDESDFGDSAEDSEDEDDGKKSKKKSLQKKQAAAALCVGVGSFSDPSDIPGLAHFLEHMVFMGSTKFPNENHFDKFIQKYGGSDNASTDCERTVFQFEINPLYLKQALDIWAQFFICPLMKTDSIDREVKAVDSEFQMAIVDDLCRREQLVGSFCRKGHPVGKFLWGNERTLKTDPFHCGIKVYDALQKFHKKYYNANAMSLVVQSPESLDTLQGWVEEIFKDVPNNPQATKVKFCPDVPYPKNGDLPFKLCDVVPVKNVQELHLIWFLPPQHCHYKCKPLHYVSWLVGHEGKGSLLSLLKEKHLALSLCVEMERSGLEESSLYSMFSIDITLTDKGCQDHAVVVDYVFQYLYMLKEAGAVERIYKEIQEIENIDFMYQEEDTPLSSVETLCENIQLFPPEDILTGDHLLFNYDANQIENVLNYITPGKCLVLLYNPSDINSDCKKLKEPYFGTLYSCRTLDKSLCQKWINETDVSVHPSLHLPPPNPFIAENFSLANKEDEGVTNEVIRLPTKHPQSKLWYKPDYKFRLPKAFIYLHLVNPYISDSPESSVCLDLLISILKHNIAEVVYNADAASLSYTITSSTMRGLIVKVSGFSDKLSLLLDTILEYFVNFTTSDEVFSEHKLLARRSYYNRILSPKHLCKDIRLTILEKLRFSIVDKYTASKNVDKECLLRFSRHLKSSLCIEGLIQGNYSSEKAVDIFEKAHEILKSSSPSDAKLPSERILKIPRNPHVIKIKSINDEDDNSMITIYLQFGASNVYNNIMLQLLSDVMNEPCFDILRTKKQLGYSVYVQDHITAGILGFSINVQTQNSKFSVEDATMEMMKFLTRDFLKCIKKMDEEEFMDQVKSLIAVKTNDDSFLGEEVDRNWDEIMTGDYNFKRIEQEVAYLKEINFATFKKFFEKVCLKNKRQLFVQVRGNTATAAPHEESPTSNTTSPVLPDVSLKILQLDKNLKNLNLTRISDLEDYKRSSYYYPVSHVKDTKSDKEPVPCNGES